LITTKEHQLLNIDNWQISYYSTQLRGQLDQRVSMPID